VSAPLGNLLDLVERDPTFRDVLYAGADGVVVPDVARPYLCAAVAKHLDKCVLAVVPTEAESESLRAAASEFIAPTALLCAWDVLPYEGLSPDPRVSAHRLEAMRLLAHGAGGRVVVASVRAFVQKPACRPKTASLGPG
jgi:transcription-repair coupling factor (superfamily II helicase)